MISLAFILTASITAAGFIWVLRSGSPGLVRDPIQITVRIDEEPPDRRIPVEIRSNTYWR